MVCLPFAHGLRRVERKGTRVLQREGEGGQRNWALDFDDEDLALAKHFLAPRRADARAIALPIPIDHPAPLRPPLPP